MSGPFNPSGGGGSVTFASQAEAEAGVNTTKSMNPLRTAQAIAASLPINAADFLYIDEEEGDVDGQTKLTQLYDAIGAQADTISEVSGGLDVVNLRLNGFAFFDPPETSSSPGSLNSFAIDADFLYICIATDTWKRIALSTW